MNLFHRIRGVLVALSLVFILTVTSACAGAVQTDRTSYQPSGTASSSYNQLERGDTAVGQNFADWVVQTAHGLVKDAYVRDDDKLGVVISPQVKPNEVRNLARSLAQGFHRNFPNRDLNVLMYAPDKKLILKARYDSTTKQIEYQPVG
ncbi:hypothetical protein HJG54_31465 [Leptolyngbya sp. NK1-12]|uniref:Lipoprotein n=1 Tax=Leptolyngbya sp. NK1-12 TaxID=2547451 RepID=A0AA97AK55_9CYAN|nr:hypothetical protein [Leptolyngbya sp. NK1-12]WNZ27404.1 hypothetical protein HJG54_31465 [Leptolyngbya sp. NK1-12]